MTLYELEALVTNTLEEKTPTYKHLTESGMAPILEHITTTNEKDIDIEDKTEEEIEELQKTILRVYPNGYVSYKTAVRDNIHQTVFHISKLNFEFYFVDGDADKVEKNKYGLWEATTVLTLFAEKRIFHNIQCLGEQRVKYHLDDVIPAVAPDFVNELMYELTVKQDLYTALEKLTERQYHVIDLYYFEDMTQDEIADKLDIKRTTVRDHLEAGRKRLKKLLTK